MGTTLNLRLFRKANKLTQDAVADYLGVTKGFISQVETGKSSLPEDKLQKLLDNPQWSLDEYKRMAASFLAISVAKPEDPVPVAVGEQLTQAARRRTRTAPRVRSPFAVLFVTVHPSQTVGPPLGVE